jgi:hypothetical protein
LFAEVRQRTGSSWSTYTILRTFKDLSFDTKYQDVGAFSLTMRQEDVDSLGLGDQSVIEIAPNGQSHYNMWYSVDGTTGTKTADDQIWRSLSGKSIVNWLADAIVYPSSWPVVPKYDSAGNITPIIAGHMFQNATPGTIMQTFITRAVSRGALAWLDASTFTGTTTSDSVAWSSTLTTTYTTGTSLLQVLQDLAARRLIQFRMNGMQLQIFNYDSQITHYTPEQVTFQRGKNILEQNSNTDSSQAGGTILIQGDQIAIREITDSTLTTATGRRRERFVAQGGITDNITLDMLATAELTIAGHIKTEDSLGVKDDGVVVPWTSYDVGDWVWEDVNGTITNIQIKQIAASGQDSNNLKIGLTLGDLLSDIDLKLQQRVDNITGTGASSYGALPNTVNNYLAPAAPTGLTVTPTAYRDSNGIDMCQISMSWTAVTTNVDGSVLSDLARYEIQYKIGSSAWSVAHNVIPTMNVGFFSNIPSGSLFLAQVRAVDTDGNASSWLTLGAAITLPKVTTVPVSPSTPTATSYFQSIQVHWNGLDSTAAGYGPEWARTDIYIGTSSGFTPTTAVGSFTKRGGDYVIGGLAYSTSYYIKLIAVDKSGNVSAASTASSATTAAQLSDPDLPANLVTGAKIADGTISTRQLTVASFGDSVVPNGSFEDLNPTTSTGAAHWGRSGVFLSGGGATVTTPTSGGAVGTNCQKHSYASAVSATQWVFQDGVIPTAPGDLWYVKFKVKSSVSVTAGAVIILAFAQAGVPLPQIFDANNPTVTVVSANTTTSWTEYEGQLIVPSGTTPGPITQMLPIIGTGNNSLVADIFIDDFTVRPVGGSASIKDASIVNAKIANVSADKITVGTLSADVTVSSRIKTADTGARVEMSNSGLLAFDGSGNQTVSISAADGSVSMTGELLSGSVNTGNISASSIGSSTILSSLIQNCDIVVDPDGGTLLIYALSGQTTTTVTSAGTGTFTVPSGITSLKVECWGGGGAGGGAAVGGYGGAAGAGGEYACEPNLAVTPAAVLSYQVGAGGTGSVGSANVTTGATDTNFNSGAVVAHAGSSQVFGPGFSYPGGSGSTNAIHFNGGSGRPAGGTFGTAGGGGGGSACPVRSGNPGGLASGSTGGLGATAVTGGGGGGKGGNNGGTGQNGTNATAPGGGGGGAGAGSATKTGGNGAAGQLKITYAGTRVLIASIAGVAGTDIYGNTYPVGVRTNVDTTAGLSGGYYEEKNLQGIVLATGTNVTLNCGAQSTTKIISDTGTAWSTTTWTCPKDGVYTVTAAPNGMPGQTATIQLGRLLYNGVSIATSGAAVANYADPAYMTLTAMRFMTAGDTIQLFFQQNTGGNVTLAAGAYIAIYRAG